MMQVNFGEQLPVIQSVDLLVLGATMAGTAVAEQAAAQGLKTMLIEPKTYCAAELGSWHRPWINWNASEEKLIRKWFPDISHQPAEGERLVFVPDRLKTKCEDVLIKSGCDLLYGCLPVNCRETDEGYLLMIGNRSGLQLIKTKRLIDASENSLLSAVSEHISINDAFLMPDSHGETAHLSFELVDAKQDSDFNTNQNDLPAKQSRLPAAADRSSDTDERMIQKHPSTDQLINQALEQALDQADVTWIQSAFAPGNVILDIKMQIAADVPALNDSQPAHSDSEQSEPEQFGSAQSEPAHPHRDPHTRKTPHKACNTKQDTRSDFDLYSRAFEITKQLMEEHPALQDASLGLAAERPMRLTAYDPVAVMTAALDAFQQQEQRKTSYCIRFFKPRTGRNANHSMNHISNHSANHLTRHLNSPATSFSTSQKDEMKGSVTLTAKNDFNRYYPFELNDVPALTMPAAKTDVLVVGGGTAGPAAAYAAAAEKADVILADMNSVLGGTGTIGGVHSYWFGLSQGFTRMVDQQVDQLESWLRQQPKPLAWEIGRSWNPSIKAFALQKWLRKQSVPILFNSLCVGVIKDQNKVKGALFATENGPQLILADITIDATGDGDLACFAGADYSYGSQRDRFTMWSSLAQYSQAGQYRGGVFTTNVDIGDVFDCTRYLLVNRRRGPDNCFDHGSYLTTRESRHIKGEYTVTFRDVLMMKSYPDTVAAGFSNFDPKGKSDQDDIYAGVIPSQQRFALPLRAFIPRGLEGLLVTGKAISATHDALPTIRMQSDVQEQGGACGVAAAWCTRQNRSVRDLDIRAFQEKLVSIGSLPENMRETENRKSDVLPLSLADIIKQITDHDQWTQTDLDPDFVLEQPLPVWQIMNAAQSEAVPLLLQAFQAATEEKTKLVYARLLSWHRHDAGAAFLADHLQMALGSCEGLPVRQGSLQWSQLYPDQGVMTELTYDLNLLSRVDHPMLESLVNDLAHRVVTAERDYYNEKTCLFSVVDSIARIAEAKKRPELIPALKRLLHLPEIFTEQVRDIYDFDLDLVRERLAMLKLLLARALAGYGEAIGFEALEALTQDRRVIIAKSAADCLYRLAAKRVCLPPPVQPVTDPPGRCSD